VTWLALRVLPRHRQALAQEVLAQAQVLRVLVHLVCQAHRLAQAVQVLAAQAAQVRLVVVRAKAFLALARAAHLRVLVAQAQVRLVLAQAQALRVAARQVQVRLAVVFPAAVRQAVVCQVLRALAAPRA